MPHAGVTIFLLFFGISLIDAFVRGQWLRAAFWLAIGLGFWAMDRMQRERRSGPDRRQGS